VLFIFFNRDYISLRFSTNFVFFRTDLQLFLILIILSLGWMLVLFLFDLWKIESEIKEKEKLKASLYEKQSDELKEIRKILEEIRESMPHPKEETGERGGDLEVP